MVKVFAPEAGRKSSVKKLNRPGIRIRAIFFLPAYAS